jgi:cleavage and polyadenylation specificity factor subunit 3
MNTKGFPQALGGSAAAANTSSIPERPDPTAAADRKRPLVPKEDDSDAKMQIMVLGSGQEVGRSCIMIKYQRKTVMLDCGTHPARSGESSLPFFDAWDLSEVDVALISHFHIDHAAAVPYLTERTAFKGKVFMTHPTKSIFKLVCDDIVNVNRSNSSGANEPLYTSQHVQNCLKKIEVCQYHQTIEVNGIKFTAYNAGHVLGAAMFMVEIDGVRVLYTGDYSRHEDRHLEMAELPRDSQNEIISPDILIVESTYGTQNNQSRQERESLFAKYVKDTVTSGGNALVPMFAIGRAQELMLILEEEWSRDERLKDIPIFYFGDMAKKCLIAYDTYLSLMNEDIRKRHLEEGRSPFKFNFIKHVTKTSDPIFHSRPLGAPCVAIASPGMLQSGISLELFERHVAQAASIKSLFISHFSRNLFNADGAAMKRTPSCWQATRVRTQLRMSCKATSRPTKRKMAVKFPSNVRSTATTCIILSCYVKHWQIEIFVMRLFL